MNIPFIQLFRTPNCYYFLDVNQNEFIQISKESHDYLVNMLSKQDGSANFLMPEELALLTKQGYLMTKSNVQKVRHYYSDYMDVFLERKLSKMTLQVTQNCNFRCTYCIYSEEINEKQRSHTTNSMSWTTAKKAIDFFRSHSIDSPTVNIGLYGGEPLLEFQLIREIVAYSINIFKGKKITFSITTNGTLLTDEMILFFQENDISLMISLDGPKEINDLNRIYANKKGTFDDVVNRIDRIKEIAPNYAAKLQLSMVIDPQNDFDCINSITLDNHSLSRISLQPSYVDHDYDSGSGEYSSEEYEWKYQYQVFLAILSYYKRIRKVSVSPIAEKVILNVISEYPRIKGASKLQEIDVPSGPCIPGQLRLFVNVHEQLFPCERVSESSCVMCIGTLDSGFNIENVDKLLNVCQVTEEDCKTCWCFRHCTICAKKADDGLNLSKDVKLSHCESVKASVYEKLRQHLLIREIPEYYQEQIRYERERRNLCQ